MKYRHFYPIRNLPCLHALTLKYHVCREYAIRHLCNTQGILQRRKFQSKSHSSRIINEVAQCLKIAVNDIVSAEENR